jgi:PAS domain S-box-containing protein
MERSSPFGTKASAAALALGLAVSAAGFVLSYRNTARLVRAADWRHHTLEVVSETRVMLSLIADVGLGARGFAITGDDRFLEPYRQGSRELPGHLATLAALTADDPSQVPRLDALAPLVGRWLEATAETVDQGRAPRLPGPAATAAALRDQQVMDDLRARLAAIEGEEQRLLAEREDEVRRTTARVNRSLLAGAGVSVALLVTAFVLLDREVRSRRRAETALDRERAVLQSVLDGMLDGVAVADASGHFIQFNPAGERLLGMGATDAPASRWAEHYGVFQADGVTPFPPDEVPLARAVRGETARDVEMVIRNSGRPEGVTILASAAPLRGPGGEPGGGVVLFRDVTDHRRAEESLRAYAAEVSDLYNNAPCGYHCLNGEGRVVQINDTELGWLGRSREEVLGRRFDEFLTPSGRRTFQENFPRFLARGFVEGVEFDLARPDGAPFSVLLGGTAVRDKDGRFLHSRTVLLDTTDRRRAEEATRRARDAAEAANRELEAFSYSVSHDLRAPLRSIDGFSQALVEDCADRLGDEGRDHLGRIRAAAQRMAELIDDLLQLSRIGRGELVRRPVDLSALARRAADGLRQIEPEREVALTVADGVTAAGDPRLLQVLLDNLVGNAWKFTRGTSPACIEVGVEPGTDPPVYFVRDNGAGFDMAYADKLFGAFQRLHSVREFEGSGIGLATVARIVHRHEGRVWGEGAPGRGATFRFTLEDAGEAGGSSARKEA